jgi:hypothetical protein
MEENNLGPESSQQVLEFLRVGYEYVLFIEKIEDEEKEEIFDFFHKLVPLIYLKATLLPEIEPEFPESIERFVAEEEWEQVFNDLRSKLGDDDLYWFTDQIRSADYDPVKGSLAENMTDIYQDLKDFVLLYQKNNKPARENAVSGIKSLFRSRWGIRALRALNCIHTIMYPEEDFDAYPDL